MARGWTGGQLSLVRAGFGLAVAVAAAAQPGPAWLRAAAAALALVLALGALSRGAAAGALVAWVALVGLETLVATPWSALVPLALLVHALLPPAPYGSLAARGRADPAGGWVFPGWCAQLAWAGACVLAATQQALEPEAGALLPGARLVATFAGFFAPVRPYAWLVLFGEEVAGSLDTPWQLPARVLALALLAEPAWIPSRGAGLDRVLYDGTCGLCHRAVRFLLAEDAAGARLRFAPLAGGSAARLVAEAERARLPDSVVVLTADGRLLVRSEAAAHLLERLGGVWRVLGVLVRAVPRSLRDLGYDAVARSRRRLFAAPAEACPLLPPALRARFEE